MFMETNQSQTKTGSLFETRCSLPVYRNTEVDQSNVADLT